MLAIRLALALTLAGAGDAAVGDRAVPPLAGIFVGKPDPADELTRVLVFDADGVFSSVTSRESGRQGRLDLRGGYRLYCGRWRLEAGGRVRVVDRLAESFSYPAPFDAEADRTEAFALRGGGLRTPGARLQGDGAAFAPRPAPPFDGGRLAGFRAGCGATRSRMSAKP